MTIWRYEAIALDVGEGGRPDGGRRRGELAASSEAEARAALRRIGLQAVRVRPARRGGFLRGRGDRQVRNFGGDGGGLPAGSAGEGRIEGGTDGSLRSVEGRRSGTVRRPSWAAAIPTSLVDAWNRRERRRRRPARAQLFDSLATMIRSGVPLLEAVETLSALRGRRGSARRTMLAELREALRSGGSLAAAMRSQPGWFDPVESAMVEAGQHGGTLPEVLQALSERHEEEGRLANRLAGALLYPAIVAMAGAGVAVFLSVRTLPELTRILEGAGVPVPAVTTWTMATGQWIARWGMIAALGMALAAVAAVPVAAVRRAARGGRGPARWRFRLVPGVVRTMAVADVAVRLGELVRAGVPVTEGLRVLAPTTRPALGAHLVEAAARIERGEELGASLCDGLWFDEEFRRLVDVAQASGELDAMLERVGRRLEREARRLVDRLATLLEPAVIVLLAVLVGTVVMAAVLPLVRMKDVI